MLITQHVNASMPRETPRMRDALALGGSRREWEEIFDKSRSYIWDEAVLGCLEADARREEIRRECARRGLWCAPAPAAASVGRPHVFRALFQKDIGGVAGTSDTWADCDLVAIDGGTGKLQSLIDKIDTTHLITQATSTNQTSAPATDASFSSALTTTFTAASSTFLTSGRGASSWTFMSAGAGMHATLVALVTSTNSQWFLSTYSSGANAGFIMAENTVGGLNCSIENNAGGFAVSADGAASSLQAGSARYYSFTDKSGASPEYVTRRQGTTVLSGTGTARGSNNPAVTLQVGRRGIGTNFANMRLRAIYIYRHQLNAAEWLVEQQFIQRDTGITP